MERAFVLLVLIVLMIVTATFINYSPDEDIKVKLTEVVHSIFYAPQYVAIHKGFFAEEGLDVELSTAWGGDKAAVTLMSNHADIALIGPETTIYIYKEGAENYLVNFAQLTQSAGSFLLAREAMPNFSLEDLRDKTIIGNRPGGAPQMVMEYLLKNEGIEPFKDVNIITNLGFTANAPVFKNGVGDFVQLFEPKASELEEIGAAYVVASFGEMGNRVPYTCYMARKNYIEGNPDIILRFTKAIYKGQQWVYNHSAKEIAEVIRPSFPNMKKDILVRVIERYQKQESWSYNPVLKKREFDHWQDIIIEAGELEEKVDYIEIVNTEFAEKVIQ